MSQVASTLVIEEVSKDFGYTKVLRGMNLRIEEGEFVALMGPNGAGKTTLLRMIAGLSRPTKGVIKIADVDLRRAGPGLRRRIGFVSHESLLYPELTGRENLAFHAKLFGVENFESQLSHLDAVLDLQSILDRPAGVLSRGNRQRLTLARALLHGPRILLLDEPFTGLDPESSERLLSILKQLVADGRTVILTTHDRNFAELGPQRLVVINKGQVAEDRRLVSSLVASDSAIAYLHPTLKMPPTTLKSAIAIAAKDLKVELRTRDLVGASGLFALCVLITTSFTMPTGANQLTTGILWISILFSTLLGVGRTMARESADWGIEGMLLSPAHRSAIFLGKATSSLALMLLLDVFIVLMFMAFLASNSAVNALALVLVVAIGTTGLVLIATLFSGIAVGSRLGESMLPMLVMPVAIPLMIGAVELTNQALTNTNNGLWSWMGIMTGYDLMIALVAVATFVYVVEE